MDILSIALVVAFIALSFALIRVLGRV